MEQILVINPGSTSTKIAWFSGEDEMWSENIAHTREDLKQYTTVYDQVDMRYMLVLKAIQKHGNRLSDLDAVASRGGPIAPMKGGAYVVNDEMVDVILHRPQDRHVSIIAALIGRKIAQQAGVVAYVYDAVSVDEMLPVLKITGYPGIYRRGQGHNLNMRAAAIRYCQTHGLAYKDVRLIVAHLGGGISVSLHLDGKIADIINDEDGCFAPERAGCLPQTQLVDLCYSGKFTHEQMLRRLKGNAGLNAWFGTNDTRDVEKMIADGNPKAKLVYEAMAINVARNIGKEAPVCEGKIDQIILTGGIAYSSSFCDMIVKHVSWIAPVSIIPGENEMSALALGVLRVLRGTEQARIFHEEPEWTLV
ncbi:MAG: butyrate kinase [Oribacterium sp.]|nr:butyrate kinase [Oribacterium sp.]